MQIETVLHTGKLESRSDAWTYELVQRCDERYTQMANTQPAERVYLLPTESEVRLGFCKANDNICQALSTATGVGNNSPNDWFVVPRPSWWKDTNKKEELQEMRELMVSTRKPTIAVQWSDKKWWIARVEKLDRRAHHVSFGGDGGQWGSLRLIGYKEEKLIPFVFLETRAGLDMDISSTTVTFHCSLN